MREPRPPPRAFYPSSSSFLEEEEEEIPPHGKVTTTRITPQRGAGSLARLLMAEGVEGTAEGGGVGSTEGTCTSVRKVMVIVYSIMRMLLDKKASRALVERRYTFYPVGSCLPNLYYLRRNYVYSFLFHEDSPLWSYGLICLI